MMDNDDDGDDKQCVYRLKDSCTGNWYQHKVKLNLKYIENNFISNEVFIQFANK